MGSSQVLVFTLLCWAVTCTAYSILKYEGPEVDASYQLSNPGFYRSPESTRGQDLQQSWPLDISDRLYWRKLARHLASSFISRSVNTVAN